MGQIIVDATELRRFARMLSDVSKEIESKQNATSRKFEELKSVWRDDKLREFEPKYAEAVRELDRFRNIALTYAQYLEMKASRVDRYLSS